MRKQFQKFKEKADNLVRPRGVDRNAELRDIEERVDKFRKVLRDLHKKILPTFALGLASDVLARDKRKQKIHEYNLAVTMDELSKELPDQGPLKFVLDRCAEAQKNLAELKVMSDLQVDEDVCRKLSLINEHIAIIQKQKSIENKCASDYEQAKNKYDNAKKAPESSNPSKTAEHIAKIEQYKDEMEELEIKLEKERDIYVTYMYDLLAEESSIIDCLVQYVTLQEEYFRCSMEHMNNVLYKMKDIKVHKKVFGEPIEEHILAKQPLSDISFVIELCVCFLLERGFQEEGLFRVGHAAHKLSRLKSAIDAGIYNADNLPTINDPHVIAGLLKNYLRSLPDPLLTYKLYDEFIAIASLTSEQGLKEELLQVLYKLPKANYDNLRYLIAFLSEFKEQIGKTRMSTQNIAIVISPNLLWPKNEKDQGYSEQVSSAASVNTIVELLVSNYAFFFGEKVVFYQTLRKPVYKASGHSTSSDPADDNGGFVSDSEGKEPYTAALMTQSMGPFTGNKVRTPHGSDGTSQINILAESIPRTGSNNSMSDSSSPPQRSPRPTRRKHNKAPAPHPTTEKQEAETQTKTIVRTASDATPSKSGLIRTTSIEEIRRHNDDNNVSNPIYGYSTIGRSQIRHNDKLNKPSPAPRMSTFNKFNDGKIYENFDQQVTIREKPAIPERPANLPVRPNSIHNKHFTDIAKSEQSPPPLNNETKRQDPEFPEAQTQLERIQTFNIDKQQVAIIDIGGEKVHRRASLKLKDANNKQDSTNDKQHIKEVESNNNSQYEYSLQQVPRSPRSPRDVKVKRPQIPAPPPPVTTPINVSTTAQKQQNNKSDNDQGSSDSTNL